MSDAVPPSPRSAPRTRVPGRARAVERVARARKLLLVLLVTYGSVVALFAFFQRKLLYFPSRLDEATEVRAMARLGMEPLRSRRGDVLGYRAPHPGGAEAILLVTHGNAGAATDRTYFVDLARAQRTRFEVWLVEYPGFGSRGGEPTERGNVEALLEAIDQAKRLGRPIVLLGESLGSAVASLAAAERPHDVAGLVLSTPMPRLALVASHHYPFLPTSVLVDRYEADDALDRYGGRVAFVVAGNDEVIPTPLGLAMHGRYAGPKLLELDERASHNTVDYRPSLDRWRRVFAFVAPG